MPTAAKPKVFFDADVLIAGSASTTGAAHILLHLSDLTLIEGITSLQAKAEATRNLQAKLPLALPAFRTIVEEALTIVSDPAAQDLKKFHGDSHPKDLPILVAAILHRCHYLVTFNVRHYRPDRKRIAVLKPADLVEKLRGVLANLIPG